jgi:hypothetical protein
MVSVDEFVDCDEGVSLVPSPFWLEVSVDEELEFRTSVSVELLVSVPVSDEESPVLPPVIWPAAPRVSVKLDASVSETSWDNVGNATAHEVSAVWESVSVEVR